MTLTNTELVAWWGALLATIVFIWDIVKWLKTGPRLRLNVRANSFYQDSEQISVKDDREGNKEFLLKPSIHIELINVGSQPTTIMSISSKRQTGSGGVSGYDGSQFREHFGKKLPYMLKPGDIWSCRVDQAIVMNLPGKAPIEICIAVSHLKKPLTRKVAPVEVEIN